MSCNVMLGECVCVGEVTLAQDLFDKMSERDLASWNRMMKLGEMNFFYATWSLMSATCSKNSQ